MSRTRQPLADLVHRWHGQKPVNLVQVSVIWHLGRALGSLWHRSLRLGFLRPGSWASRTRRVRPFVRETDNRGFGMNAWRRHCSPGAAEQARACLAIMRQCEFIHDPYLGKDPACSLEQAPGAGGTADALAGTAARFNVLQLHGKAGGRGKQLRNSACLLTS